MLQVTKNEKIYICFFDIFSFLSTKYIMTRKIDEGNGEKYTKIRITELGYLIKKFHYTHKRHHYDYKELENFCHTENWSICLRKNDLWGQEFIFKTNGDKFILYSIGENGIDENGEGDDINFLKIEHGCISLSKESYECTLIYLSNSPEANQSASQKNLEK